MLSFLVLAFIHFLESIEVFRALDLLIELSIDVFHEDECKRYDAARGDCGEGIHFSFVMVKSEGEAIAKPGVAQGGEYSESWRSSYTPAVCGFPLPDEEGIWSLGHGGYETI